MKYNLRMTKQFVNYEVVVELKKLGFDEPCLGRWLVVTKWEKPTGEIILQLGTRAEDFDKNQFPAPTFSQAFRFFREKYQWQSYIEPTSNQHSRELGYNYCLWNYKTGEEYNTMPQNCPSGDWEFEKYEDAELACLIKLIKINS